MPGHEDGAGARKSLLCPPRPEAAICTAHTLSAWQAADAKEKFDD